jgi:hypothetical protein
MASSSASTHRPGAGRSDESLVFTVLTIFLLGAIVLGTLGYMYWRSTQSQEQHRSELRTYQQYNDYVNAIQLSTARVEPAAPPVQPQPTPAQRLLSHPGVTPGPGFHMPGVQATGLTIIDAIDQAQAAEKSRRREPPTAKMPSPAAFLP